MFLKNAKAFENKFWGFLRGETLDGSFSFILLLSFFSICVKCQLLWQFIEVRQSIDVKSRRSYIKWQMDFVSRERRWNLGDDKKNFFQWKSELLAIKFLIKFLLHRNIKLSWILYANWRFLDMATRALSFYFLFIWLIIPYLLFIILWTILKMIFNSNQWHQLWLIKFHCLL